MVVFYCDLDGRKASNLELSAPLTVNRRKSQNDLSLQELRFLENSWNPRIMRRLMAERFQRGASVWLAKWEEQLAGYGWTLTGMTMEPHFFPLGVDDVHLFDFFVLPEYRGRRINPSLIEHILGELAAEHYSRALIEAGEWNQSQLSSLGRTPFRSLGVAIRFQILEKTLVLWNSALQPPKGGSCAGRGAACAATADDDR